MTGTAGYTENYDVIVIGAGHAGCEAALSCARLGLSTLVLTMSVDQVAYMPCNPHIGGSSKGHLVREIDALGGEMGKNIDKTFLQSRMLNTSKGPAVHSLRAQADKRDYSQKMRETLEKTEHLRIRQAEVAKILVEDGKIIGAETVSGKKYLAPAVILCTGTYLNARCVYGEVSEETGPNGLKRATHLSDSLRENGLKLLRFKTGTPARIDGRTVDLSKMEEQKGDETITPFSFENKESEIKKQQISCYLTYTNENTHRIIRDNIDRSPLYSGAIRGTGPRYCPSIEDKVMKFPDKDRHQLFIEPEGRTTQEMYVQGLSTSLPADVQEAMLHTIPGLERAQVMRYGYAIEYDCLDPQALDLSFMVRGVPGLFSGGQINGSSGYEEAAAQGFYAGVNAALYVKGEEPFIIGRDEGYLGVLVDDLVTKGTPEPYRMMTSRCEYRLLLRQDNADERLTEKARRTGLISNERYEKLLRKRDKVAAARAKLDRRVPADEKLRVYLESVGETVPHDGAKLFELLKRPGVTYTGLLGLYKDDLDPLDRETLEQIDVMTRYDGYIDKERREVERMCSLENLNLPIDFDYNTLSGLRLEARQKLNGVKPANIGQASRISGVSPADVSVLLVAQKRGML